MAYNGNINLISAKEEISFTAEQVQEFIKCSRSPTYFIEKYVKIVHVDRGLINFALYDYQKEIIDKSVNNRFVICKLPRQSGKTTTIAGLILWYTLFHENHNTAILANKRAQALEIVGRIQLAYEHLPKWLKQPVSEWNKGTVEFGNGSRILASATSSSAIRGGSFNLVYLDEFAFVDNNLQEDFFASVYPTISSGKTSKVLITSTPNGLNMFYKLWVDSEEKRNDYQRIEVTWSDVPGRDEKWKEETIRNTSPEQFRVEFECEFVGSSNTLINGSKLRSIPYRYPIKSTDDFKIYSEPSAQRLYMIVVDVSRGTGKDYSAFVVFDITEIPYNVVAVYRNNEVSTLLYPTYVHHFARLYNNALVLVETNDVGKQIADILHQDLEYENVVFTALDGQTGQAISGGFGGHSRVGVKTTKVVKKLGCANFKTLVEMDRLVVNDLDLLNEMYRFVAKGDSFEAESGNDDLVMCCVLLAWAMIQPYMRELTSMDIRANVMNLQEKVVEEDLAPFGLIDDGQELSEDERTVSAADDNWLWQDQLGFSYTRPRAAIAVSDDSWLAKE
jgi:hypothetical protein